jgi:hypothetical protein
MGKMASKLKWGYATQQQAAAKGIDAGSWQKSKNALAKVEKLFADKLQGSKSALQNAILKGKAGNLNGMIEDQMLGELGDPATATVVAAAAPIIIATINILKEAGLIGKNENIDINKLSSEIANDPSATAAMMEIESSENLPATNDPIPMSQTTSESTSSTASGSSGGGIMNFIKKNPVPAVIGGGLLAFGIYQLVKPKPKTASLSGYRTRKSTKKTAPAKSVKSRGTAKAKKLPVKSMKLF